MLYIPIRTTEGRAVGSVRVESGAATLNFSLPDSASAYLLTEGGLLPIAPNQRLSLDSPLRAIAVADDNKLLCYGLAPDCRLSKTELWACLSHNYTILRSEQDSTPPASEPVRSSIGAFSHHVPVFAEKTGLAEGESVAERSGVASGAGRVDVASDAGGADVASSVGRAGRADAASGASGVGRADVAGGVNGVKSTSIAESEAVTAAFSELLRRASAVYRRIDTHHEPMHRAAITEPLEFDSAHEPMRRTVTSEPMADSAHEPMRRTVTSETMADSAHEPMRRTATNETMADLDNEPQVTLSNDWLVEVDRLIKGIGKNERHSAVISNPFPNTFPNSSWTAVGGEGIMPHLEGEWQRGNELFKIIAVPGTYAPRPPKHLFGFTRFLRTRRGGFWVKLLDR